MELPHEDVRAAVDEGQRLRGWITNGYAQMEYLFGEIIVRANEMSEYFALVERLPHRPEKRIDKIREILSVNGFFSQHRQEIEWLIEAFEHHQPTRHLLVHGFCTAYHTPDGDFGLEFRKWHRDGANDTEIKRVYRLINLEYEREQFTYAAQRAIGLVKAVHEQLGLIGYNDQP